MNLLDKHWLYFEADDKAVAAPPAENPPAGESSPPEKSSDAIDVQAEVDKRAAAIKREAKKEALAEFLQELGFEDKTALSSLVTKTREQQEAEKSDLTKAMERIEKLEGDLKAAGETLNSERTARRKADMLSVIAQMVRAANVRPDREQEALLLMNKDGALDALLPDEGDFKADNTDALKIVSAFKDSHKEWFTPETPGTPSNADATNPTGKEEALRQAAEAQRKIIRF